MTTLITSSANALGLNLFANNQVKANQKSLQDYSNQKLFRNQLSKVKGGDDDILIVEVIGG